MATEILYDKPVYPILLGLFVSLLLACEIGYRGGRRNRPSATELFRAQVSNIQGALVGLFALLLGFTFAMSLSRFDTRKEMVVQESNAIGTAALCAGLLPAPQRAEAMDLFRRYIEVRVTQESMINLQESVDSGVGGAGK